MILLNEGNTFHWKDYFQFEYIHKFDLNLNDFYREYLDEYDVFDNYRREYQLVCQEKQSILMDHCQYKEIHVNEIDSMECYYY